jgi:hypothetical protein
MRKILMITLGTLSLCACSNHNDNQSNTDMNAVIDQNMTADQNAMMDQNGMMDENAAAMNGAGGADGNAATNEAVEKQKDLNTNDRDTNLANGI